MRVLFFQAGETVLHHPYSPGGLDEDGYPAPAGPGPGVEVHDVGIDKPASVEPRDGTVQRATVDLVLFLPPGFTCDPRDEFTIRGHRYKVEGVGEPLPSFFTGGVFRTEVEVRRHDA